MVDWGIPAKIQKSIRCRTLIEVMMNQNQSTSFHHVWERGKDSDQEAQDTFVHWL